MLEKGLLCRKLFFLNPNKNNLDRLNHRAEYYKVMILNKTADTYKHLTHLKYNENSKTKDKLK